jgi:hypothetical protein
LPLKTISADRHCRRGRYTTTLEIGGWDEKKAVLASN